MWSAFACLPALVGNSAESACKHGIFERHAKIVMICKSFENGKAKAQRTQIECLQGLTDCCDMPW